MSEKERAVHPQEPAEGEPEDIEAPGVERAGDPANPKMADVEAEEVGAVHPDEPAEGGEDEVDEQNAERSDDDAA